MVLVQFAEAGRGPRQRDVRSAATTGSAACFYRSCRLLSAWRRGWRRPRPPRPSRSRRALRLAASATSRACRSASRLSAASSSACLTRVSYFSGSYWFGDLLQGRVAVGPELDKLLLRSRSSFRPVRSIWPGGRPVSSAISAFPLLPCKTRWLVFAGRFGVVSCGLGLGRSRLGGVRESARPRRSHFPGRRLRPAGRLRYASSDWSKVRPCSTPFYLIFSAVLISRMAAVTLPAALGCLELISAWADCSNCSACCNCSSELAWDS